MSRYALRPCVICGKEKPARESRFSIVLKGYVCTACAPIDDSNPDDFSEITQDAIEVPKELTCER